VIRLRRKAASARQARLAFAVALLLVPAIAHAQPYRGTSGPRGGSFELGGGVLWTGGYDAGSGAAMLSPNSSTGGSPITLFTSESKVAPIAGVEARAAVYVGSRVSAEASFQYSRPVLRTTIGSDFENAESIDATETLSSYLVTGSLVYHFGSGRVVPFVRGGGGYLRQLHEDNAELLTGSEVHGGGGVKIWFGSAGSRFGLRLDAGVSARSKSVAFEQTRRVLPAAGAGVVYLF
jgi:hypothetical protein